MKIIGLVGESKNDRQGVLNLLAIKYPNKFQFIHFLKHNNGTKLDTEKGKKMLNIELTENKFNNIIFIKDSDCLISEKNKIAKIKKWFNMMNKISKNKGVLLLNIESIEALILSDIVVFNDIYKTKIKFKGNPSLFSKPKTKLKNETFRLFKEYHENDIPYIFLKLNYDILLKNNENFKLFDTEFNKAILLK